MTSFSLDRFEEDDGRNYDHSPRLSELTGLDPETWALLDRASSGHAQKDFIPYLLSASDPRELRPAEEPYVPHTGLLPDFMRYNPERPKPFQMSRPKLMQYLKCSRCFYRQYREGVRLPDKFSDAKLGLNRAIDIQVRAEIRDCRNRQIAHPNLSRRGFVGVPLDHRDISKWQNGRSGLRVHHQQTGFLVKAGIDEIFRFPEDYRFVEIKAGWTEHEIDYSVGYKQWSQRQVDLQVWLAENNEDIQSLELPVSRQAYFIFVNADPHRPRSEACLSTETVIVPYEADTSWVEPALISAYECLEGSSRPAYDESKCCDFCNALEQSRLITATNDMKRKLLLDNRAAVLRARILSALAKEVPEVLQWFEEAVARSSEFVSPELEKVLRILEAFEKEDNKE